MIHGRSIYFTQLSVGCVEFPSSGEAGNNSTLDPAGWYKMSPRDPKGNLNPSRHSFVTLSRCVAASNGWIFHPKGPNCSPRVERGYDLYTMSPGFFVWPCQKKSGLCNVIFRHGILFGGFMSLDDHRGA